MRSVSGTRNRLVLVLASLVALLAAAWLASATLGAANRWPQADAVLPHAESTPLDLVENHGQWMLPVAVAATVLALVIGIWLLVAQVPSRAATAPLQFAEQGAATLGTLDPAVLERALSEHVEGISGVLDASVQVTGSASSPWVQASVTIAEDAETGWVAQTTRERLAEDVRTVLGTEARQVDLLIHLRSSAAPSHAVIAPEAPSPGARQEATAPPATVHA